MKIKVQTRKLAVKTLFWGCG